MRAASLIAIIFTCMHMVSADPFLESRRLHDLKVAQQAVDDDHLPELEKAIEPNVISEIDELQRKRGDGTHADFIVVGSGAGGGPMAARLAESGFTVLLLEAGKQKSKLVEQVPGFVSRAQEDHELVWNYWVQHLDPKQEEALQDGFRFLPNQHAATEKPSADLYNPFPKTFRNCTTEGCEDVDFSNMDTKSVLYPRGSAVGGSTVINNNVGMMAPDSDWNRLASLVGDESWSAPYMRSLLQEIEDNHYVRGTLSSLLQSVPNGGVKIEDQHGYSDDGGSKHWLHTDHLDLSAVLLGRIGASMSFIWNLLDWDLVQGISRHLVRGLYNAGDASSQPAAAGQTGGVVIPTLTHKGKRFSVRNRIEDVRRKPKSTLYLLTDTFVRRVVFHNNRASGVEVDHGEYLYSASPKFDPTRRPVAQNVVYRAKYEVIISAGAFETPKLLAFSGIGPDAHHRHDPSQHVVISDNVGSNLQDKVELSVTTSFDKNWKLYEKCTYLSERLASKDPCWQRYMAAGFDDDSTSEARNGAYGIGTLLGDFGHGLTGPVAAQSQQFKLTQRPDIFYFSGPVFFEGYRPGFGFSLVNSDSRHYSFLGLEAYTESSGHVRVESENPFQQPAVNFRKFSDPNGRDLQRAKTMFQRLREDAHSINAPAKEDSPGLDRVPLQYTEKQLEDHILTSAWGHHCCCTASMGKLSTSALDAKFRVRNSASHSGFVDGLRVVDASIWPENPGYFPMVPLILASEKAAMDIITQYRPSSPARWFCLQKITCMTSWRQLGCSNLRVSMHNGRRQDLLSFPSNRVISGEPCLNAFPYFGSADFDLIEKGRLLDHRVTVLAVSTGENIVEKEFDGWGGWVAPTYKVAYKVLA